MAQYFRAILLDDCNRIDRAFTSMDYASGQKVTEQAVNSAGGIVEAVQILLATRGPRRVVWAGQLAPPEPSPFWRVRSKPANLFWSVRNAHRMRFALPDLYPDMAEYGVEPTPMRVSYDSHPNLLNHDRCEVVDKRAYKDAQHPRRSLHPLPLLTAEGLGSSPDCAIGMWARNAISVSAAPPAEPGWACVRFDLELTLGHLLAC